MDQASHTGEHPPDKLVLGEYSASWHGGCGYDLRPKRSFRGGEFSEAGLKARPSAKVKAPGIEGCLAWAECILEEELIREKFVLIIGKVVHLEVDERFFNADGSMDFQKAKPLSAMLSKDGVSFNYPAFSGRYAEYREMFGRNKNRGMACAGCSVAVEKALSKLDGVSSAKVDQDRKTACIDYDPAKLTSSTAFSAKANATGMFRFTKHYDMHFQVLPFPDRYAFFANSSYL